MKQTHLIKAWRALALGAALVMSLAGLASAQVTTGSIAGSAVDETGGQIAIFGRIGSRPFTREEQQKFFLRPDGTVWSVSDTGKPADFVDARPPAERAPKPAGDIKKAEAR